MIRILCTMLMAVGLDHAGGDSPGRTMDVGPLSVLVEVDATIVSLAETVTVTLIVTAPESIELKSPTFGGPVDSFQVIGLQAQGPDLVASEFGRLVSRRFDIRLEPLQLGTFDLGSMEIDYKRGNDDWSSAAVPLPRIEVVKGPTSSDDPSTLRPPPELPVGPQSSRTARILRWLGGGLLLCIVVVVAYQFFRATKARPALERARRQLDEIEASGLLTEGQYRAVAERVCQAIRDYLEPAYALNAPRQSTSEFLGDERTHQALTSAQRQALAEFLKLADVEKFGPAGPGEQDCLRLLHQARSFLMGERTR